MTTVALLLLTAGCTPCNCIGPTGPRVDMNAATEDLRDVLEGTFVGVVEDDPIVLGSGDPSAPCSDDGAAFTLTLAVADPICTDPDDPERDDVCDRARYASYALSGTFAAGETGGSDVVGSISIWSNSNGLRVVESAIGASDERFPLQHLALDYSGESMLDGLSLDAVSWERRISEAEDPAVWESCQIAL